MGAHRDRGMSTTAPTILVDLAEADRRALNAALHDPGSDGAHIRVVNPAGRHALAVGAVARARVEIEGHAGYYCAGMNQHADIRVLGNAGVGVAENMMSGTVVVEGDASASAGATAHGGLLVVHGSAAARCAISLKGADVVVRGSVGAFSAFMAQSGRLLVCGDAGDALGDSIYEARLYVRGAVRSLGADCVEKEMRDEHLAEVAELLERAGIDDVEPGEFSRYGSSRTLYHWNADHHQEY
jgi:glutamate synthase domain-containing protein 3